jgi:dihydropteroate synthase
MGILNVTPDSFFDGGRYFDPSRAAGHALEMVAEGADLIDVGGESSRPVSAPVPVEEEARRVWPVIEAIRRESGVPISVDTTKAAVAAGALDRGADIVNDISALHFDPEMAPLVAERGAAVVLMHMQGTPQTMQTAPQYRNVVGEVRAFLAERAWAAEGLGVAKDAIILDPGIGFGKTAAHSLALLGRLDALVDLGYPVLVGPSRKSFIGRVLGLDDPGKRLEGTLAALAHCVAGGAAIVRVHDVKAAVQVARMSDAIVRDRGKA